jgi:2-keto-4-pentenoate hydratase
MVLALAVTLFLIAGNGLCGDDASRLARHFAEKSAVTSVDAAMTLPQAMEIQKAYVAELMKTEGPVVGYKAGLTNEAVQKSFGVTHPLRGTLLGKMLLPSGTALNAAFGARPLSEGDLILRVADDGINKAGNAMEALRHIDAAIPFIELPDLMYGKDIKINGPLLAAVNVAARLGVMGDPIPVEATPAWFDRLASFKLEILDEKGTVLVTGEGKNLLNHPLNVVLWIKDSLNADGIQLKKGDLLSLGTITKLMPAQPGTVVKAKYTGLDPKGPVTIEVRFQ